MQTRPPSITVRHPAIPACLAVALAALLPAPSLAQVVHGAPDPGVRIGMPRPGAAVTHVCVDATSHPAWMLFYGLTDAARPCARRDLEKLPLAQFRGAAMRDRLRGWMKHESYAASGVDVIDQIVAFVRQSPGAPIGLTFDGGMAVTFGDYDAAEKRHAAWRSDPAGYARANWGGKP